MKPHYFWVNGKVVPFTLTINDVNGLPERLLGKPSVDPNYDPVIDGDAYSGKWHLKKIEFSNWSHIPIEELPAEFRAHLLIMGVL